MEKKKTPMKAFQSVMNLEIVVDISAGQQKKFKLEVKPLGGEKLTKYNKDLEKAAKEKQKSKEDRKALASARKEFNRLGSRFEDINETIALLRSSNEDGSSSEELLSCMKKKEAIEAKLWEAEDALEALTEDDAEMSTGELIIKADKEMKKLFDLIVLNDDGLSAFMENEEIGYLAMTQYIEQKMREERGND